MYREPRAPRLLVIVRYGWFGMGLDPGTHVLEVYDTDLPSKWRPLPLRVELGQTIKVDCR